MGTDVRQAHASDLGRAADTLAAAFADYPWTRYVLPETDYSLRLRELQGRYLEYAHACGLVAVTDDCDGVIALLPPNPPAPDPAMVERIVALHGDRVHRLGHTDPPASGWRLETLGVRPGSRGAGRASKLLEFALAEVDARGGKEVSLDTSDPRNVRLYERHGFTVVSSSEHPGRPPVWAMSRSPSVSGSHPS